MELRPVRPDDKEKLSSFRCALSPRGFEVEVERFFSRKLAGWQHTYPEGECLVLVDDVDGDETILGALAWEPGDSEEWWFIRFIAVARKERDRGHGTTLLESFLDMMSSAHPGENVYWKVHEDNTPMHKLSALVGADPLPGYEGQRYVIYAVQLALN